MPTYVVTGPDGVKYRVTAPEGATEQQIRARVQMQPKNPSKKNTFVRSFTQGGLAGFLDEAGAVADTLGLTPGRESVWESGDFRKTYRKNRDMNREILDQDKRANPKTAIAGEIGGAVTSMLVAPGGAAKGFKAVIPDAAYGAAYGVGDSRKESVGGVAKDAAKSAALGVAGGMVGRKVARGVGRVLAPKVDPAVRALADEGVTMTPGQIMGGRVKGVEDRLAGMPIVGEIIGSGRRRGLEQFNRAAIKQALKPIGSQLPADVPAGRQAIEVAQDAVSGAYDDALAPLRAQVDDVFEQGIQRVRESSGRMPQAQREALDYVIADEIAPLIPEDRVITGENLQAIKRGLDAKIASYKQAPGADSFLVKPLQQLRDEVIELAARSDPGNASAYRAADNAFANMVPVNTAAAKSNVDGVFTPKQLAMAARQSDRSARKGAYARGAARMQDFAETGAKVLPSSVPDSGTAGRIGLGYLLGNPQYIPVAAAAGIPYAPGMDKLLQKLLIERPELFLRAGQAAPKVAAPLGMFGAGLAVTQGR